MAADEPVDLRAFAEQLEQLEPALHSVVASNPGRWLHVEGALELDGDVVKVGGIPLAVHLRSSFLEQLELAGRGHLELGRVRLEVTAC